MRYFNTRTVLVFIMVVLLAIIVWAFFAGIGDFGQTAEAEQLETIKTMIERAAIQCYALEGGFPPNIEHLQNYGVVLNNDKFFYVYDVIGSNVMPSIQVIPK